MMIFRFRLFACMAGLAMSLLTANRASAVPSIINGGFEEPAEASGTITDVKTFTGTAAADFDWTPAFLGGEYLVSGNYEVQGARLGTTPFGTQYLGLDGFRVGAPSVISQSATGFLAGTTYAFTFYLANLGGESRPNVILDLSAGTDGTGDLLAEETYSAPANEGPYGDGVIDFVPVTTFYTPTEDRDITFSIQSVSNGLIGIDNVSLAVVPEPTTTATILAAGGLAGLVARRRARRG